MMADLMEGCAVEAGQVPHVSAVSRAGFKLGVVMPQSHFPRLRGDFGNPESFPFPVIHRRVEAATSRLAELMGAVPTKIEAAELSQAFATGVADSMISSGSTGYDQKI